jgi:hypothetical protein
MKDITNIELITTILKEWDPGDLAFIKKINMYSQENTNKLNVDMHFYSQERRQKRMWLDRSDSFFEIVLEFRGITDLKLHFSGHMPQQITGFDIITVTERGWENINFIVEDYENGIISFNAEEIAVLSVSEPIRLNL